MTAPRLFTFDFFGTVVDWRTGLRSDLERLGVSLDDADFERVIDAQAEDERATYRPYADITARSLVRVLGVAPDAAAAIGAGVGRWPVFADAPEAMAKLQSIAPCAATTNSDRAHRVPIEAQLGMSLAHWVCAEDVRAYKPDPRVILAAGDHAGVPPGPWWWHVSAYADYDLETARSLGLTTVFVARPHARAPVAGRKPDLSVPDLADLAALVRSVSRGGAVVSGIPTGTERTRPFMPARDYDLSMRFYEALGFEQVLNGEVGIFNAGSGGFILQRAYEKEWAENFMMQLLVDDLDAWWAHIARLDLPARFGVQAPKPPAMQPWGLRTAYVYDPSGVLWHVAQRREGAPQDV